jgi:hypothetical protein
MSVMPDPDMPQERESGWYADGETVSRVIETLAGRSRAIINPLPVT